jgi:hypothetical protein
MFSSASLCVFISATLRELFCSLICLIWFNFLCVLAPLRALALCASVVICSLKIRYFYLYVSIYGIAIIAGSYAPPHDPTIISSLRDRRYRNT